MRKQARALPALGLVVLAALVAAFSHVHSPDGRTVFLQSETALLAAHSFSMHVENTGDTYTADREFPAIRKFGSGRLWISTKPAHYPVRGRDRAQPHRDAG